MTNFNCRPESQDKKDVEAAIEYFSVVARHGEGQDLLSQNVHLKPTPEHVTAYEGDSRRDSRARNSNSHASKGKQYMAGDFVIRQFQWHGRRQR
jgi:hypothetical protein